jgi:hypothetical protein
VSLDWNPSSDNVGVTSYDIYGGPSVVNVPTSSGTVSGLSANTTYTFYVRARDAAGNVSAASTSLAVTTGGGTCTPGSNRVGNGDFESGNLSPWGGTSVFISSSYRSGSWGARLGTSTGSSATLQQTVTGLSPNTTYTVKAWLKVAATSITATLGVDGYGSSATAAAVSSTTWTERAVTFTTSATATSARIYVAKPSTSTTYAYADDVSLVVECGTAARHAATEAGNEAFETRLTPNPAAGQVTLHVYAREAGTAGVTLTNAQGLSVKQLHHALHAGANAILIQTRELAPGPYVVQVGVEGKRVTKKLIVTR